MCIRFSLVELPETKKVRPPFEGVFSITQGILLCDTSWSLPRQPADSIVGKSLIEQ